MKTVKNFINNKNLKKRLFTPGPASLLYENITSIEPCFGRGDYQYQKIEDNVLNRLKKFTNHRNIARMQGSASFALEVIINFNDYSNFIPGCTRATLISRELPIEIGRLEFNVLGKEYYIESENTLDDSSIIIRQLKGPFEKFEGRWSVTHINKNLCQIDFDATYELPFLLNAIIPEHLANNFSKNIIDSFIKRIS